MRTAWSFFDVRTLWGSVPRARSSAQAKNNSRHSNKTVLWTVEAVKISRGLKPAAQFCSSVLTDIGGHAKRVRASNGGTRSCVHSPFEAFLAYEVGLHVNILAHGDPRRIQA